MLGLCSYERGIHERGTDAVELDGLRIRMGVQWLSHVSYIGRRAFFCGHQASRGTYSRGTDMASWQTRLMKLSSALESAKAHSILHSGPGD